MNIESRLRKKKQVLLSLLISLNIFHLSHGVQNSLRSWSAQDLIRSYFSTRDSIFQSHPTSSKKDLTFGHMGRVPQFLPLQNRTTPARCRAVLKAMQHKGYRCIQHSMAVWPVEASFLFSLPNGSWSRGIFRMISEEATCPAYLSGS